MTLEEREDGRFYVVHDDEVLYSAPNERIGRVYLDMAEEEILAANPDIVTPQEIQRRERGMFDINRARVESSMIGKAKSTAKGGRGGRGGV